jgi:hypothetical protein
MSMPLSGFQSFINRNMRAKTAMTLAVGAVMVAGITGFTFVENQLHPSLTTVSATTEEVRTVTLVDVEPTPSNFETVTVSGSGGVTLPAVNVITVSGSAGVTL